MHVFKFSGIFHISHEDLEPDVIGLKNIFSGKELANCI
jgi:hypothetical protein